MSHHSNYNTKYTTASSAPIYHRPKTSHYPEGEMSLPSGDLLALIPTKEVPKKPPSKHSHYHLGAPSKPVSKRGKKVSGRGGDDGETEDGSSDIAAQDDEDADDEDDEDADDEKPAVNGPARVKLQTRQYIVTEAEVENHIPIGKQLLKDSDVTNSNINSFCTPKKGNSAKYKSDSTATETITRAGQHSKKRSYSNASTTTIGTAASDIDDAGITETDEEPDYPRKRIARGLSKSNGYLQYSVKTNQDGDDSDNAIMEDSNVEGEEGGEEDEEDDEEDDDLDEETLLDEDENDIKKVEEAAIIRELDLDDRDLEDISSEANALLNDDFAMYDGLLEDLDPALDPGELDPRWCNPLPNQGNEDELIKNGDLFPVPGSQVNSPPLIGLNENEAMSPQPDFAGLLSSEGWSEYDGDSGFLDQSNPFFEKEDLAVKHFVNTKWDSNWMDDTEDEHEVWKYCIASGESSSEGSSDESSSIEDDEGGYEESDGEYDSDATDVEENLPLPTPRKDSKLRRLSISSPAPQVIHRDPNNRDGPFLGSWIADSDRPICIIDGNRKTILLPPCPRRFSLDSDASSHQLMPLVEDSEHDTDMTPFNRNMRYQNPTLGSLSGGGGYLNDSNILAPPEAFAPVESQFDDFLRAEYGDAANDEEDESLDEGEKMLTIEDLMEFSSTDEDEDQELADILDVNGAPRKNPGNESEIDTALTRWDIVSVTAFRKRQQLHKQRLADQSPSSNRGKSALKRLNVTDTTMAPARRRKKAVSRVGSPTIGGRKKARKEEWNYKLSPLFEGQV